MEQLQNQQIKSTQEHCKFCFDVILAALDKKSIPKYPENLMKFSTPLFVTWTINQGDLRGCIGTFSSSAIETTLPKYAQISAFQDSRFSPISKTEVKDLSVSVSLLVNFEEGKQAFDWVVGKHGIIIDFEDASNSYNATYLPEVAHEQNWNQEQTIKSLVQKAGFRGNYKNVLPGMRVTTYESSKQTLSYQQYQSMI